MYTDPTPLGSLTVAELRFTHAKLTLDAERLRSVWRGLPPTTSRSAPMGRQVKALESRAADYARILSMLGLDV
jgi:hypothetical protein